MHTIDPYRRRSVFHTVKGMVIGRHICSTFENSCSATAGPDPFAAAPLTCAGVTTYKAVEVAATRFSDLVAVSGIGGLGHLSVQNARIAGASGAAVELNLEDVNESFEQIEKGGVDARLVFDFRQ